MQVVDLQAQLDAVNGYVLRAAIESGMAPETAVYYISGMWDGATSECAEWFPSPSVTGRPGGGAIQPIQESVQVSLEPVLAATVPLSQADSSTTSAAPQQDSTAYATQFKRIEASAIPIVSDLFPDSDIAVEPEVWMGDPDGDGELELAVAGVKWSGGEPFALVLVAELAEGDLDILWQVKLDYYPSVGVSLAPDLNRDGYLDVCFWADTGGTGGWVDWFAVGIRPDSAALIGTREGVPFAELSYSALGVVERSSLGDALVIWENGQLEAIPIDLPKPADSVVISYNVTDAGIDLTVGDRTSRDKIDIVADVGSTIVLQRDPQGGTLHNILTEDGDIFGPGDAFGELTVDRPGRGTITLISLASGPALVHVATPDSPGTAPATELPMGLDPATVRQFVRAIFEEFLNRAPSEGELIAQSQTVQDLYSEGLTARGPFDLNARYREAFLASYEREIQRSEEWESRQQSQALLHNSLCMLEAMVTGQDNCGSP